LAKLMAENLRPQDLLVFLGSDKFSIMLPETPSDEAVNIAERLRIAMTTFSLHNGANDVPRTVGFSQLNQDTRVTISVGIAEMQPGDVLDSLFSKVHLALYQAKAAGRNQVKLA